MPNDQSTSRTGTERQSVLIAELEHLDPGEERSLAEEGYVPPREAEDIQLNWLQSWYLQHCDDDWEHQYGIKIETLDNPGWRVNIDLMGTALEGRSLPPVKIERSETDWLHSWVEADQFHAAGGAKNLTEILRVFREWSAQAAGQR